MASVGFPEMGTLAQRGKQRDGEDGRKGEA